MTGRANIPRKAEVLALLCPHRGVSSAAIGKAIGVPASRACGLLLAYRKAKLVRKVHRRWRLVVDRPDLPAVTKRQEVRAW